MKVTERLKRIDGRVHFYGRLLDPGPWDSEPDHVDFEHAGFPCMLHRNGLGSWCGYVAVPPGHPWFEVEYDNLNDPYPEVHGGLTYSAHCQVDGPLCHKPKPGEPDNVWWLGFDCNHCDDISLSDLSFDKDPTWPKHLRHDARQYKTVEYVRAETIRLANQARKAVQT